ncbi:UDP-N-acetylmuramate dehydrogenase [Thermodesulfovibrionales bacterium]|nr:UDP-N-acetylmuramate dehydrogenase [Thermodesulfovibrionales bacterium]
MKYEGLKKFCISEGIEIRLDEAMSRHTSLKIGGPADIAIFPDEAQAAEIVRILLHTGIPYIVVGNGTNVLVKDSGLEGVVIFTRKMNNIKKKDSGDRIQEAERVNIIAQAGCSLLKTLNLCVKNGLSGMEGLAGIPGSIGGAIVSNAGSFGYEIGTVVETVNLLVDGRIKTLLGSAIGFGYRRSKIPPDSIILSAVISLKKNDPFDVRSRVNKFADKKKSCQPLSLHSAGCVFKNPEGMPAGKIIEETGCKGLKAGGIEVSNLHANFFINDGGGTADAFLRLMGIVCKRVEERTGIILEPEIEIIGRN